MPSERRQFATATALHSVARQVGAVLGIALVVALIGAPAPAEAAQAFDRAWTFSAVCLGACGLGALALARGSVAGTVPSLASAARAVRAAPVCRPAAPRPAARMVRDASPRALAPPARDGREDPAEFLRRVAIFADLPHALRADIVMHATSRRVQAGSWLFRRGDPGDCLYIVRAGRLEVLVPDGDGLSQARVVGRGGVLGELALLEDVPRSACVRAVRDTDLMAISRERFLNLLLGRPQLGLALARALGAQLRDSSAVTSQVRALPGTIAIVALTPGVPVAALGERLVAAIGRHAPVSMLDGGEGEPDCSGEDRIAEWGPLLDRREHAGRHVVLVAGDVRQPDPWTRFCLQQADRILAVSTGGPVGEWVAGRAELHACELIGWDIAEGSGVLSAWADALAPEQTHLLRSGAALEAGVQRLARHVTGRAVGLVLSGGGARAFAHIGVLEELRAAGVTIDRVAGVSMGAYIGAMAAMGLDPAAIDARCHEEWVRRRPLSDYTVPRHAIIRGDRCRAMFRRTFGAIAIEELELGYFSASADLRSGELVVHRWGGLAEHVSTSMCLPGIAPPQVRGRRLLVDGGLVDNLPVTTMAALGDGPIIAVDVKATLPRPPREDREPRPPFIGETLMRSLVLGSANTTRTARRHADLVITPSAEGVGMLEFHQIDRAVEIGREAARAALADAPESLLG